MSHDEALPVTSSIEPAWPPGAQECYRDVLLALRDAGVPHAIGGAFAMHEHTGIWRATKDLDVMMQAALVPQALQTLSAAGFQTYVKDPVWLAKARRGEHFVDLITGLGNAGLSVDDLWIKRAVPAEILGVPCKILRPEEMIASKVFVSRRERFDGAEVAHLIRLCAGQLDWNRLLQLLDPHWELLLSALIFFAYVYPSRTALIPESVWEGLLQRFGEHIRHPHPDQPFRGSLIDPLMFAIDVDEWGERDLYREYCEQTPILLEDEDPPTRSKA
ncbi:MAG TPA: nucleotidyltransferase [Acidobacteriaceae bacterium]|jgi:hypothetical protein|nr:nucleotidyltransferase [Acidobacteriaceae bacterium]